MSIKKTALRLFFEGFSVLLFWVALATSLIVAFVIWEWILKWLCNTVLTNRDHCYYVDPIWDIPEKTFVYFILPSWFFLIAFYIYIFYRSHTHFRKVDKSKKRLRDKDYFLVLLIILWLIPIALLFLGNYV